MTLMEWFELAGALVAGLLLLDGLRTGTMPNAVIEPQRVTNPIGFWALGVVYAVSAVGLAITALKEIL
jgi:hypothetical protein